MMNLGIGLYIDNAELGGGSLDADLTASSLTASITSWIDGSSVTFDWTVANNGLTAAIDTPARVYMSATNPPTTSDILVGSANTGALDALASVDLTATVTLDYTALGISVGTYYLAVIVDPAGSVTEANEGNNTSNVLTITVAQENVTAFTLSDTDAFIGAAIRSASAFDVFTFPNKTYGWLYLKAGPTGLPNSGGIIFDTFIANNGTKPQLPQLDAAAGEYIALRAADPAAPPRFTEMEVRDASSGSSATAEGWRFEDLELYPTGYYPGFTSTSDYTHVTRCSGGYDDTLSDYRTWTGNDWKLLYTAGGGTARFIQMSSSNNYVGHNRITVTAEGIAVQSGTGTVVEYNDVNYHSADAISVTGGPNTIRYNIMRNCMFDQSGNHPDIVQLRNTTGLFSGNVVYGNEAYDADFDHPNGVRLGVLPTWSGSTDYTSGDYVWSSTRTMYQCNTNTGPGTANASDPETDGGVIWIEPISVPAGPQGIFWAPSNYDDLEIEENLIYSKAFHGIESGASGTPAGSGVANNNFVLESQAGDVKPPNAFVDNGAGSPTTAIYLDPMTSTAGNIASDFRGTPSATDTQVQYEDYATTFIDPANYNFHLLESFTPAARGPLRYRYNSKTSAATADTQFTSPACSTLPVTDSLTIEMRVNLDTTTAQHGLFGHDSERIRVIVLIGGEIRTRLGTGFTANGTAGDITDDTWCTVRICIDGAGQEMRVYVDNVLKNQNTAPTSPQSFTAAAFLELFYSAAPSFLLNYAKIWYSVDNTNWIAPRTRPDKIINGTVSEVNGDSWFAGAGAFT